jgi:hypothetical protein
MNLLIAIPLVALVFNAIGQSESNSRFGIGMNFSSDIGYRNLKNEDGSSMNAYIINYREETEIPKFGFSIGMNVCYELNKHFALESGMRYSNKGYQTKYIQFPTFQMPQPILQEVKFVFHYNYMDIPLRLNYTLGDGKIRFLGSFGMTTNVFLSHKQHTVKVYSDRTEREIADVSHDFKRITISPTISTGLEYSLNEAMNFRVELIFMYGMTRIIDASVTAYLYNAGLNIGYYIRL